MTFVRRQFHSFFFFVPVLFFIRRGRKIVTRMRMNAKIIEIPVNLHEVVVLDGAKISRCKRAVLYARKQRRFRRGLQRARNGKTFHLLRIADAEFNGISSYPPAENTQERTYIFCLPFFFSLRGCKMLGT